MSELVDTPETRSADISLDEAGERSAADKALDRLHPGAGRVLAAFGDRPAFVHLRADQSADDFVAAHDGKTDIYVVLGTMCDPRACKPKKTDMSGSRWCWVDVDPPSKELSQQELEAWRADTLTALSAPDGAPPPSLIIDSGRGYWALWELEKPCRDPRVVEAANLGLAAALGEDSDSCHSIDHVARLPGTINTKTSRVAAITEDHPERRYAIEDLPAIDPGERSITAEAEVEVDASLVTPLPDGEREKVLLAMPTAARTRWMTGDPVNENAKWEDLPSRSESQFSAIQAIMHAGATDQQVYRLLLDPDEPISQCILMVRHGSGFRRRQRPEKYAVRQIEKARSSIAGLEQAENGATPDGRERPSSSTQFTCDKNGKPTATQHNVLIALAKLGAELSHDRFADRLLLNDAIMQDEYVAGLYLEIDDRFGFRVGKEFFWMIVEDQARQAPFHPVLDYLGALTWDGTARLDCWLIVFGGAEDTPYVRAVSALPLIAAVRRVRDPGSKFDEMLVLRSPQGTGKSTALATLCPNPDWFTDDLPLSADTKTVIERLQGRWLVEAAELKGMRKGEIEHIKSFLSRQVDRSRMAYGRLTKEVPRQCVFIGTTNAEQFLRDSTGNRRFWPVAVGKFDLERLSHDRDQLWAEAAHREAAGESIRLDPALYPAAAEVQEDHEVTNPFEDRLANVLADREGKIRSEDIWRILDVPMAQRPHHTLAMGEAMQKLGWRRANRRFGHGVEAAYVKGDEKREILCTAEHDGGCRVHYRGEEPYPF